MSACTVLSELLSGVCIKGSPIRKVLIIVNKFLARSI